MCIKDCLYKWGDFKQRWFFQVQWSFSLHVWCTLPNKFHLPRHPRLRFPYSLFWIRLYILHIWENNKCVSIFLDKNVIGAFIQFVLYCIFLSQFGFERMCVDTRVCLSAHNPLFLSWAFRIGSIYAFCMYHCFFAVTLSFEVMFNLECFWKLGYPTLSAHLQYLLFSESIPSSS